MHPIEIANRATGRAIGVFFLSGFGAVWIALALYARGLLTVDRAAAVAAGLGIFVLAATRLLRSSLRWPRMTENPARSRAFHIINAAQWVAIFIVANLFSRLHWNNYEVSAIAAIVGFHFLPLGKLFRSWLHHAIGLAMVLWAGVACLMVAPEYLPGITAMGAGIILWVGAAASLAFAFRAIQRLPEPPEKARSASSVSLGKVF